MPNEFAHVGSSDAIDEFRAALLTFQEEALTAVEAIEMKAGQTLRFLDEEVPGYWETQTRTAYDELNAARIALSVCRNRTVAGRKSSCIEEKKAYNRSQDRVETCRRQRSVARSTSFETHEAADEFRARISHLHRILEAEVPKLQALLQRTAVSLEAYTATRPHMAKPFQPPNADDSEEDEEESEQGEKTESSPNASPVNGTSTRSRKSSDSVPEEES